MMTIIDTYIEEAIGNTPIVRLFGENVYAKLEGTNYYGSMKDRSALYVIKNLLANNVIDETYEIVESSSGNFAISLAGICNYYGIKFTCVTDPLLNPINRAILTSLGANIQVVTQCDEQNIYVGSRIALINKLLERNDHLFWINQYNNPLIPASYEELAKEILDQRPSVEYIFIPVSTCGTISGVSQVVKKIRPDVNIVAVDLESSSIFRKATTSQHLPGMGFNCKPGNLKNAIIDHVVIVNEIESIMQCRQLAREGMLIGASSGCVVAGIKRFLETNKIYGEVVGIFPDRGERYINTVYDDLWCKKNYPEQNFEVIK